MELTAEQFKRLVADALERFSSEVDEKRAAPRVPVDHEVTVRPIFALINVPATPFTARLREVSYLGVGLTAPVEMAGKFRLELLDQNGKAAPVTCTAKSCRRLDAEEFEVGATFD